MMQNEKGREVKARESVQACRGFLGLGIERRVCRPAGVLWS